MSAIFVGSFLSVLSSSTITIAIPELQRHFGVDLSLLQWTLTGFMLAMGTSAPLTGYLGGRFSFKRVYVATLVGFILASVLCGVAWDAQSLVAFRLLQGAFCGAIMPVTMTLIYQLVPRVELFAFVEGINDVYLVATVIALVAVPLSLMIRKQPRVLQAAVEAR